MGKPSKLLSVLMSIVLAMGLMPLPAFAETSFQVVSPLTIGEGDDAPSASELFSLDYMTVDGVSLSDYAGRYAYTGGGICPQVCFEWGDASLVEGEDYWLLLSTVTYVGAGVTESRQLTGSTRIESDRWPTEPGSYHIKAIGKGELSDHSLWIGSFDIVGDSKKIAEMIQSLPSVDNLVASDRYTIYGTKTAYDIMDEAERGKLPVALVEKLNAAVEALGSFDQIRHCSWTINGKAAGEWANALVEYPYTGDIVDLDIAVSCEGEVLEEGVDYVVAYHQAIYRWGPRKVSAIRNPGRYVIAIEGMGRFFGEMQVDNAITVGADIGGVLQDVGGVLYSNGDFVIQAGTDADGSEGHSESDVIAKYEDVNRDAVFDIDAGYTTRAHEWYEHRHDIKTVSIVGEVTVWQPYKWFLDCDNLVSADLTGLHTDFVTYMSSMFENCSSLASITIPALDTSRVTDMGYMFSGCSSLAAVDLSSFDTSKVRNMYNLFLNCSALKYCDLSSFDTSSLSVDNEGPINGLVFRGCNALTHLVLGDKASPAKTWELPKGSWKLQGRDELFETTPEFVQGYDSSAMAGTWVRSPLDSVGAALYSDGTLELAPSSRIAELDESSDDIIKVYLDADAYISDGVFSSRVPPWYNLRENIKSAVVTSAIAPSRVDSWFKGCVNLTTVELSDLDTKHVTSLYSIFSGCEHLKAIDLSELDTRNVTNMSSMFSNCVELRDADISSISTDGHPSRLEWAFCGCVSLARLLLGRDCSLSGSDCGLPSGVWLFSGKQVFSNTNKFMRGYVGSTMAGEWTRKVPVSYAEVWMTDDYDDEGLVLAYDGDAKKPLPKKIVFTDEETGVSKTLKRGTDYLVSYKNNVQAGTASIVVSGVGDYTGSTTVKFAIAKASLAKATVSNVTYTGKTVAPAVKVGSTTFKAGIDYTVTYKDAKGKAVAAKNLKAAGTYKATVKGKGSCTGSVTRTFQVVKDANPMSVAAKSPSVAYSKAKAQVVKAANAYKFAKKAVGAVTYARIAKGSASCLSVNAKTGDVTVKKGTKKGTYAVVVKVAAKGNANYKSASKTITVKVKVK